MAKLENWFNKIVCGDCLELLTELPNESIDLVITSPPYYKQRDYGYGGLGNEKTPEEYIDNLLKVFHECIRVTKKTGSIVFNIGDKYEESSLLLVPYRFALKAVENEPITLVNMLTWVKQNPTPRQYRKRLVSSTEPFFHFVKSNEYYYDIDAFLKSPTNKNTKEGNGNNVGKKYFELIEKSELSANEKKNAIEELNKVILEVKTSKIFSFRMKIRGLHSLPFGGQNGGRQTQIMKKGFTIIKISGNPIKRDVIESPVETIKGNHHPAVYPEYIIRELLKLLTKKGDFVLDPFMGSGTTAVACKALGRSYIGFELSPEYCRNAEERIKTIKYQPSLASYYD